MQQIRSLQLLITTTGAVPQKEYIFSMILSILTGEIRSIILLSQ